MAEKDSRELVEKSYSGFYRKFVIKRLVQDRGHAANLESSGIAGYNPKWGHTVDAQKWVWKRRKNSGTRVKTRFNTVDAVYGFKK